MCVREGILMESTALSRNLFDYATSELSQDAFICWLSAQWDSEDETLRRTSQRFLHRCLGGMANVDDAVPVRVLTIMRQYRGIDVLLIVSVQGRAVAVVIEDKVYAVEHDEQLERYRKAMAGLSEVDSISVVYYKTGSLTERQAIRGRCDVILDRKAILDCLSADMSNIVNPILCDYVEHLKSLDAIYEAYSTMPLREWNYEQFCGFFENLEGLIRRNAPTIVWTGYGYNDNRSGGHWTFWCGNDMEVGDAPGQRFMVNIESPSASRLHSEQWLCRALVRHCGDGMGKHSRNDLHIPDVNDQKYRRMPGNDPIVGTLFEVKRDNSESKYTYHDLENLVIQAIDEYTSWCQDNRYVG